MTTQKGGLMALIADTDVKAGRLGEFTAVLRCGTVVAEDTVEKATRLAEDAVVNGAAEFVIDLTRVGRYETPAMRSYVDLWRRLHGLGFPVFVACTHPGLIDCMHRVIPARGKWTLHESVTAAVHALLITPV